MPTDPAAQEESPPRSVDVMARVTLFWGRLAMIISALTVIVVFSQTPSLIVVSNGHNKHHSTASSKTKDLKRNKDLLFLPLSRVQHHERRLEKDGELIAVEGSKALQG